MSKCVFCTQSAQCCLYSCCCHPCLIALPSDHICLIHCEIPPSRAPAEGAGGDGPAAGQPADRREGELRQRRPDARPGAGRRPDGLLAPGRHSGPGRRRLRSPWELQPAQHREPRYVLIHEHDGACSCSLVASRSIEMLRGRQHSSFGLEGLN